MNWLIAFLILVLVLVLLVILWIAFAPVYINVDSATRELRIRQWATFLMSIEIRDEILVNFEIFGFKIRSKRKSTSTTPKKKKPSKPFLGKKSFGTWSDLIIQSVRSFSVRKINMDIDTGDVCLNARLVPVCYFASRGPVCLRTNFTGDVKIDISIVLFVYKAVWAFVKFLIKK